MRRSRDTFVAGSVGPAKRRRVGSVPVPEASYDTGGVLPQPGEAQQHERGQKRKSEDRERTPKRNKKVEKAKKPVVDRLKLKVGRLHPDIRTSGLWIRRSVASDRRKKRNAWGKVTRRRKPRNTGGGLRPPQVLLHRPVPRRDRQRLQFFARPRRIPTGEEVSTTWKEHDCFPAVSRPKCCVVGTTR